MSPEADPWAAFSDAPPAKADADPWAGFSDAPPKAKEPAPEPAVTPHEDDGSFMSGLGKTVTGMVGGMLAGEQKTAPIREVDGKLNYTPLGEVQYSDSGPGYLTPDRQWTGLDPQKHVVLNDPQSGKATIYARRAAAPTVDLTNPASSGTDEGTIASLGRLLGPALLAPSNSGFRVADQTLSKAEQTLSDFAAQKVDPTYPAVSGSRTAGIVANTLRETPGAADAMEGAAQKSIAQTGAAAERNAASYGTAQDAKDAGDVIQDAVQGFVKKPDVAGMTPEQVIAAPTRTTSFSQKAGALFDRLGSHFGDEDMVPLDNTLDALKGPVDRFPTSTDLGKVLTNPKLQQYFSILRPHTEEIPAQTSSILDEFGRPFVTSPAQSIETGGQLTFPEVKELRSTLGRMLDGSQLTTDIPRADLKTVYGALSKDLESAAETKGPDAIKAFRQANDYYSAGMDRIDQLENLTNGAPEAAYGAVLRAAQSGTKGDIGKLMAVRRATPDDQWGNIAAATIRTMGKPIASQADPSAETAFSIPTFLTNYSKLSEGGRNVLFNSSGMAPLRTSLDQLVNVVSKQKNVTKLANPSGTGRTLITAGLGASAYANPVMTGLGLVGANVAARAIMNPTFVRWLYSTASASPAAGAIASNLARLDQIATRDTSLQPIAQSLRASLAHAGNGNPTTGGSRQPTESRAP